MVTAVLAVVLIQSGAPTAQRPTWCEDRQPRYLAMTELGTIIGNQDDTRVIRSPTGGSVKFVDMCFGSEISGLAAPSEATASGACQREFGPLARTEMVIFRERNDGSLYLVTQCIGESVESICEAVSDCAIPNR